MKAIIWFTVMLLVLSACKSGNSSSTANPPLLESFSGVWAGDSGPIPNALNFGSKIELQEDAGVVSGEFFDEDPGKSGVFVQTGHVQGIRDGGTLFLTHGTLIDMGDAGVLYPQPLILTYDGGVLAGIRILQVPGQPPITIYVVLHKQ